MTTLTFDVVANDRGAGRTIKEIGGHVDSTGQKMNNWRKGAMTIAATGAAFGVVSSIAGRVTGAFRSATDAFSESEQAQTRLQDAFARFPKLADINIEALRELNGELMKKTKFDDDAIASGQAVLAQFNLTGKQLKDVTPLLLDYAAKTGQSLPDAAEKLGKSFLGNTRALKELGINYKSTGDQAKDTENIIKLLRGSVGGFAEKEGATAAGRLEIMKNQFGELQEQIGAKLIPILTTLADWGLKALKWIDENKTAAIVIGSVTAAVWLLNAALAANPVVLVTALIAGLVAGLVILWTQSEGFRNFFIGAWNQIRETVMGVVDWIVAAWNNTIAFFAGLPGRIAAIAGNLWSAVVSGAVAVKDWVIARWNDVIGFFMGIPGRITSVASRMWSGVTEATGKAKQWIIDRWNELLGFLSDIPRRIGEAFGKLGEVIGGAFKGALNIAIDVINWFIRRINDIIYGINLINPFSDIPSIPEIARLHEGGIVPGSAGQERLAILEAGETVLPARTRGMGTVVNVNVYGPIGSQQELENWLVQATDNLRRRGRL